VKPDSFRNAVADIAAKVQREGLDKELHPAVTRVLTRFGEEVNNGVPLTLKNLDTLRRVANAPAKKFDNPDEQRLAKIVVEKLDDYMHGLQPGDVVAGDQQAGVTALNQARDLWSRFRKSDAVDELMRRAEIRASQFSGSGYENALRTEFRQLAMNRRKMAGFSEDERAAIEKVARGGPMENSLRMLGKFAPTGVVSAALSGNVGAGIGSALGRGDRLCGGRAGRRCNRRRRGAHARRGSTFRRHGDDAQQRASRLRHRAFRRQPTGWRPVGLADCGTARGPAGLIRAGARAAEPAAPRARLAEPADAAGSLDTEQCADASADQRRQPIPAQPVGGCVGGIANGQLDDVVLLAKPELS
jgi:hypothetical protein